MSVIKHFIDILLGVMARLPINTSNNPLAEVYNLWFLSSNLLFWFDNLCILQKMLVYCQYIYRVRKATPITFEDRHSKRNVVSLPHKTFVSCRRCFLKLISSRTRCHAKMREASGPSYILQDQTARPRQPLWSWMLIVIISLSN